MRRLVVLTGVFAFALATACGGDKAETTTGPTGGTGTVTNGTFKATINGTSWGAASAVGVSRSGNIVAVAAVSPTYTLAFGISNLALNQTGTFSLNTGQLNLVNISTAAGQTWSTVAPGSTGSIVITTYTANRIAGTFSFTAAALSGGATGTLTVSNGSFDVTF
jgi:hypothetical protein